MKRNWHLQKSQSNQMKTLAILVAVKTEQGNSISQNCVRLCLKKKKNYTWQSVNKL